MLTTNQEWVIIIGFFILGAVLTGFIDQKTGGAWIYHNRIGNLASVAYIITGLLLIKLLS